MRLHRSGLVRSFSAPAIALLVSLLSLPAFGGDCPAPAPAEAEGIARAYFDAFNKGDRAALDGLLAADYKHQGAVVEEQDRGTHLDRMMAVRTGFPDGVYTIDWLFVDGDTVVVRHAFRGTQTGEYTGVPPSGNKVAVGAFHVHRIACGKIAETWNAGDGLGLFYQIGALKLKVSTPPDEEPKAPEKPNVADCPATTPEENKAAARRWYDEALNQRHWEVLDEIVWPEEVHHAGLFLDTVGVEGVKGSLKTLIATFPDLKFSVDGVVAGGDKVLVRWTGRGTHTGTPFLGVATGGKPVEWSGMNAFRFACGKIIEGWSEANGLTLLRQLGGMK